MSTYPVVYEQTPAIKRSRLTVFFRIIMVIPHFVVSFFYGIAAWIGVVLAWVAIVVTGRYPQGLYKFVARLPALHHASDGLHVPRNRRVPAVQRRRASGVQRASVYPRAPGSLQPAEDVLPLHLYIPVAILLYIFLIWIEAVSIALWFVAVIVGRTPTGLSGASGFPLAYLARAYAYGFLLTDRWPPLDD
jgi:hypothetical protein